MRNEILGLERNYDGGSNFKGRSDRGGDRGGRGGFGGGSRGGFSGGSRGGDRGGARAMYSATCAECNKPCEVPFKPTGNKPVLCSNCFAEQSESRPGRGNRDMGSNKSFGERSSYSAPSSHNCAGGEKKLEIIASKLDRIIELLSSGGNSKKSAVETVVKAVNNIKVPAELTIEKPAPVSKTKKAKKAVVKKPAAKKVVKKAKSKK